MPSVADQVELLFSKEQRFEHQKEFRIIFATNPIRKLPKRLEFIIGDIGDIAELL